MTVFVLTDAEVHLAIAAEQAGEMKFPERDGNGLPTTVIRAEALRRMLLGLDVYIDATERTIDLKGPGVRVEGAYIEGELDLDNACAPNGDPLPRLSLIECFIPETISLRAAKMRRLCLKNSRISYLRANDTVIGTQLDLEGVTSANAEIGAQGKGLCRVALRGAQIEDGIEARDAVFVGPPKRDNYVPYEKRSHYALDLAGARIDSDVRLFPECCAFGGINMSGIEVSGSVQLHGATITSEEVHALDLEGAHIEGHLDLCSRRKPDGNIARLTIEGEVHMPHARIDDGLKLYGTHIKGRLTASYLKVGSDVDAQGLNGHNDDHPCTEQFKCDGDIILNGARLEGNLNLCGAVVNGEIYAPTCTIGGDFEAHPFVQESNKQPTGISYPFQLSKNLNLEGSHIDSDLNLTGAHLAGELLAKGIKIAGFCRLSSLEKHIFKSVGKIEISNATIGLDLDMKGAVFESEIYAKNIRTGGDVLMRALQKVVNNTTPKQPFIALKRITLSGAAITGDLDIEGAKLHEGIRCRGTKINSALMLRLVPVTVTVSKPSIDLTNAHANVLIDGKGDGSHYTHSFRLALEGFTYGRFGERGDIKSALRNDYERDNLLLNEEAWKGRLRWLDRQYSDKRDMSTLKTEYKADTYNTLYRVLKNNGYTWAATRVLIRKLSIERKVMNSRIIKSALLLYQVLFGFGLRPLRTLFVFCAFYLGVCFAISYANFDAHRPAPLPAQTGLLNYVDRGFYETESRIFETISPMLSSVGLRPGVLVIQPVTLSRLHRPADVPQDYLEIDPPGNYQRVTEVNCGDRIKPTLYTFDMIIPAIEFNQTNKCDFSSSAGVSWSIFKALATLLGWIVTSITILTLSGIIRRQSEPS